MPLIIGNAIADSLQMGINYANRLLVGVGADQFARWARPGGEIVRSNHGAFVLGHLSLYAPRIVEPLGGDAAVITPPERFMQLFSRDAKCEDDPAGLIYPAMDEIVDRFMAGYGIALERLRATDDSLFQQPNPSGGRLTEVFPTIASMQAFYAGGHLMMHLGQVSAWRRMLGLGEA